MQDEMLNLAGRRRQGQRADERGRCATGFDLRGIVRKSHLGPCRNGAFVHVQGMFHPAGRQTAHHPLPKSPRAIALSSRTFPLAMEDGNPLGTH